MRKTVLFAAVPLWLLGAAGVHAQDIAGAPQTGASQSAPSAAATATAQSAQVEEIVVTAQRRSEDVSKVPMAISAFSGAALERSGIPDTQALQLVTPGLIVGNAAAYSQTYLRGIGDDATTPGTDSSVATYVDGVYRSQLLSGLQSFLDIDHVEVLKGPQGTLYGRNALGGAINIVTKSPSRTDYVAEASATYGNYDRKEGSLYVSGPISSRAAFSVGATIVDTDGYVKNLFNGQRLESDYHGSVQAKLIFDLNDSTHILINADHYGRDDSKNTSFGQLSAFPLAAALPQASVLAGAFPAGSASAALLKSVVDRPVQFTGRPWRVYNDAADHENLVDQGASIQIWHQFRDFELRSITAYRDVDYRALVDIDGTNRPVFSFAARDQVGRTITQDFQLTSSLSADSPFAWIAGAQYLHDHSGYQNFDEFFPILGILSAGVPEVQIDGQIATDAYAAYAQGSYALTSKLKLTGGLRYSNERKDLLRVDTVLPLAQLTIPTAGVPAKRSASSVTGHASLQYQVTPDAMAYVSFDQGFKSGTFNTTFTGPPDYVSPEKINAYQAGFKAKFLERRLSLDVSGFYYDYSNLQVQVVSPTTGVTILQNAASAELYGADFSAQAIVTPDLRVSLGAALLHSEYDKFVGVANIQSAAGGNAAVSTDFSGNRLTHAPEYTLTSSLDYALHVANLSPINLNVNYYVSGKYYFDSANTLTQKSFSILNASASYDLNSHLNLRVWARNLTDKAYLTTVQANAVGDAIEFNEPRMYGLTVKYRF